MRSRTVHQILRLLGHLPKQRLISLVGQLLLSVLPGFIDLLIVSVIARLTGALSGAALIDQIPGIHVFGGSRPDQSLWLIALFIGLSWCSSLLRLLLRYLQNKVSSDVWRDLANKAFGRVLAQKYEFHLTRKTPELAAQILQNFERISSCGIRPVLQLFSALITVCFLSVGVLIIGRGLAVYLILALAIAYWSITALITPRLRYATKQRLRQERESNEAFYETLASIRDINLVGNEYIFEGQFQRVGDRAKKYVVLGEVLPELPRGLIEPLGITLIFLLGAAPAILAGGMNSLSEILPFLATMAIAALKITSPLQDVFRAVTMLRGSLPYVDSALEILELPRGRFYLDSPGVPSAAGLNPKGMIRLVNVSYSYPGSDKWVLKDVNLAIPVGSRVALVGSTGAGKSTVANIFLGLLEAQSGFLELDGIPVEGLDVPAWKANCAQVPQQISLLNKSILENITFEPGSESVDLDRVWEALSAAQLDEFVANMTYGLYTQVGENGLRLSGGQRQRLALARAFYRRANFLVLDEATSALDNRTESEVIQALEVIGRRCTTLVIAHRLTTVQRCDRIYELHEGRVRAHGSYEELKNRSQSFRELTQLEHRDLLP